MAISEQTRQAILDRDNCRCRACGFSDSLTMEVDHITPRSRGGSDSLDNLQALCHFCNNVKDNVEIESLAIKPERIGFGDQVDVTAARLAFQKSVAWQRHQHFLALAHKARVWKTEGTRGLTIRKRLDKLTTSGIVEEILSTIR